MVRPKRAEVSDRIAGLESAISALHRKLDALAHEMDEISHVGDGEGAGVIDLRGAQGDDEPDVVVDLTDGAP